MDSQYKIGNYNLTPPSKKYALNILSEVLGEETAKKAWDSACETCKLSTATDNYENLQVIFSTISEQDGVAGAIGRSLIMRSNIYNVLKKTYQYEY